MVNVSLLSDILSKLKLSFTVEMFGKETNWGSNTVNVYNIYFINKVIYKLVT